MTQAIKISKIGIDVGTATEPNDFIFNSDFNTFKILESGTTTGTVSSSSTGTVSIDHNQSFSPPIMAFSKLRGGSGHAFPLGAFDFFPRDRFQFQSVSSDDSKLYFEIQNTSPSEGIYDISYYVFEVPL